MIFDNLAIYCDWLMDQGVECDLLQARINRSAMIPLSIPSHQYQELPRNYSGGSYGGGEDYYYGDGPLYGRSNIEIHGTGDFSSSSGNGYGEGIA